jgi:Protein of unknown function (DUF2764)
MSRYFYLAASLPEIELDKKPPISFSDFLMDADVYLSKSDRTFVTIMRELIDIENIRRLLLEQKIDDRGNLSEQSLDEAILAKVNLPEYAIDFLEEHTSVQSKLNHIAQLYASFFQAHLKTGNSFLDKYLSFEHELRLWISLLRAQKLGIDFRKALQFEDPQDPLIMSMIIQSQNLELILPDDFRSLKDIFANFDQDPIGLHKKIEQFRLDKITELTQDALFKVDNILGFIAKLLIVEQWQSLNQDVGLNRLNRFAKKH